MENLFCELSECVFFCTLYGEVIYDSRLFLKSTLLKPVSMRSHRCYNLMEIHFFLCVGHFFQTLQLHRAASKQLAALLY